MNYELITALAVFVMVASATPGPNNLMLLTSGANFGFKRTIPHISGIVAGFALMVVLVGTGLMQLFTAFPVSYLVLKFASIGYLLFLAWKIATAASFDDNPSHKNKSKPFTFTQAALFQWVNPKGWSFALAALSAYTPPSRPLHSVFDERVDGIGRAGETLFIRSGKTADIQRDRGAAADRFAVSHFIQPVIRPPLRQAFRRQ